MAQIRIGVSGWSYASWRGKFYPPDLARKKELQYLSSRMNSLEINGSFYSLLSPKAYRGYRLDTPAGFVCAVKASRFITHLKRLKDVRIPLANFWSSGVLKLEEKLGPLLWQLPKGRFDAGRLGGFLQQLPRDTAEAAQLAADHDERMLGRADFGIEQARPLRHALEVRGEEFMVPELVELLRRHNIALVFSHSGSWPYREEITADFVYIRLHGAPYTYASDYDGAQLDRWADRIKAWSTGEEPRDSVRIGAGAAPRRRSRDVYLYFDNDYEGRAPFNALQLMERLNIKPMLQPTS